MANRRRLASQAGARGGCEVFRQSDAFFFTSALASSQGRAGRRGGLRRGASFILAHDLAQNVMVPAGWACQATRRTASGHMLMILAESSWKVRGTRR